MIYCLGVIIFGRGVMILNFTLIFLASHGMFAKYQSFLLGCNRGIFTVLIAAQEVKTTLASRSKIPIHQYILILALF